MENQNPQEPVKIKPPATGLMLAIGIGVGAIIVFTGVLVYNFYFDNNEQNITIIPIEEIDNDNLPPGFDEEELENIEKMSEEAKTPFETGEDTYGKFIRQTERSLKDYTQNLDGEIEVAWHDRAKPLGDSEVETLMKPIDTDYKFNLIETAFGTNVCPQYAKDENKCSLYVFEGGTIKKPDQLSGNKLYYVFLPYEGMGVGMNQYLVFVDENLKKFILIQDSEMAQQEWIDGVPLQYSWFAGKMIQDFAGFDYPDEINIPGQDSKLIERSQYRTEEGDKITTMGSGADKNLGGITNIINREVVKLSQEPVIFNSKYGDVHFDGRAFFIVLPDGSGWRYELLPYFFEEPKGEDKEMYPLEYKALITWDNKELNNKFANDKFVHGGEHGSYGCGGGLLGFSNITSGQDWFDASLLTKVAVTNKGESIFELSDKESNPYYKSIYDYGYASSISLDGNEYKEALSDEEKYADFLADIPIIFWKDHIGNWRVYQKSKYRPMAECGKPVIYLYPEEETKVNVQVAPNGGFTITDPEYPRGGWDVLAKPNGELYYFADGQTYPYLFWEGHSSGFGFSDRGFIFSREEVSTGMRELLYKTGLNKQEAEDFMEFWEEKLTVKPFVFITFTPQRDFEKGAPLTVIPKPDTVIRVFMDYKPLDERIEVEPLPIRTPERRGFTVIEWGGVLHN